MFRPKALSFRFTVCRLGSSRREVKREESAVGISERRRPVKMSARLATWWGSVRGLVWWRNEGKASTYLERLLGSKDIGESGGCLDSDGVALEAHLFHVFHLAERFDVRFYIFGGVELDALALEGENLGIIRHFHVIEKDMSLNRYKTRALESVMRLWKKLVC